MAEIKKPCSHPGCPMLVGHRVRYCPRHVPPPRPAGNKGPRPARPNRRHLYSYKWEQARKAWLAYRPNCAKCGERAHVVDHIRPHRGDPGIFWDRSNWQSMCTRCHNQKTALEDGAFGRSTRWDPRRRG